MIETARTLVREANALVGYTQSDEITLAWYEPSQSPSDYGFDGRFQKLASVLAGMASVRFFQLLLEHLPAKASELPHFDCRIWQVPTPRRCRRRLRLARGRRDQEQHHDGCARGVQRSRAAREGLVGEAGDAVPEGLLHVLSDGVRGTPRTLLTLAPEVAQPTASPSARAPWFVRAFQRAMFTPARLWEANAATVIPFPDLEARRRMTRRERLAMGGALAPVIPLRAAASAGPGAAAPCEVAPDRVDHPVTLATGPTSGELHAELAAEVGDAAEALPLDLV